MAASEDEALGFRGYSQPFMPFGRELYCGNLGIGHPYKEVLTTHGRARPPRNEIQREVCVGPRESADFAIMQEEFDSIRSQDCLIGPMLEIPP